MSRKHHDKGKLPPFVPLLIDTLNSPAWRALSHGARSLYIALKRRYSINLHNNGRMFLPCRQAALELGSGSTEICRWLRELQHYGFIVMTAGGSLGIDGKGKAPHWRLTELGYMREPPTRDFLKWDGTRFDARKKQNPVPESWNAPFQKSGTPPFQESRTLNGTSVPETRSISEQVTVPGIQSISRFTTH
jgi:hypothetical protein